MAQLPLKIRVDIRDKWDYADSAVNKSVQALKETLGQGITPEVEWQALWAEIGERYPQKETFVPYVVMVVTAWNQRLQQRLEDDAYADWTEQFLEVLSEHKNRQVRLHIQSSGLTASRPTAEWNASAASFVLKISNAAPISLSSVANGFDSDFGNLFKPSKPASKGEGPAQAVHTESATAPEAAPTRLSLERLPTLDMLQRPEELLRTISPHILIVDVIYNKGAITVQCSHQASLELLAGYLEKWGRKNNYSARWPNILKVDMIDCDYSFGVQDSLIIRHVDDRGTLNPTVVLAFVEGILGYKMIHTNGSNWVYRTEKRFA